MWNKLLYMFTRDIHVTTTCTLTMAVFFLMASYPWGGWFYNTIMTDSIPKAIFGTMFSLFIFVPLIRLLVAIVGRDNTLLRIACGWNMFRSEELQTSKLRKIAMIQIYVMTGLIVLCMIALVLSVVVFGITVLLLFNNLVLILSLVALCWAVLFQLYSRIPRLQNYKLLRSLLLQPKQQTHRYAALKKAEILENEEWTR